MTQLNLDPVMPGRKCPSCGELIDCATNLTSHEKLPEPEDLSICASCKAILKVNDRLQFEILDPVEMAELAESNPEVYLILMAGRELVADFTAPSREEGP